jgi:hypothetical protein
MRKPHPDDLVRLVHDLPQENLRRGTVGIVRSTWCSPLCIYEVEFPDESNGCYPRALLIEDDLEMFQPAPQPDDQPA